MSTDPDKNTPCPESNKTAVTVLPVTIGDKFNDEQHKDEKTKKTRSVSFPGDDQLVTQYFEPANPWQDVPLTTRAELAAEYLEACRKHETLPIDGVLQQIRELPDSAMGFGSRAARLTLSECILLGSAPADALEAVLRKVQFRRIEVDHAAQDDEGAEALFDMIEYYESATSICLSGPRQFGIRGWQAAARMIKKSAELTDLEVRDSALEAAHAPVLARALRPHACRLRALCLQRAELQGESLLCLVIALKSNNSVRELRLGDNRLTTNDAAQLASLLRINTRIQLLDLSNNLIQDAGLGHLATALSEQAVSPPSHASPPEQWPVVGSYESRGLAFLVLWNNQLTRNCAHHLTKALSSSPSLCVLNVGRNAIGVEGVRALCCGSLTSLGLQAARLTADAAHALAQLVLCTSVQRLDLRENRLGCAGLQAIATALKDNNTITQIDLDDVPESTSTLAEHRLTRDIRARCRGNSARGARAPLRRISLTGHAAVSPTLAVSEAEPRGRLRSPLPSPAGSPVPAPHHASRFSVTKVTPDRESLDSQPSTPTRPSYCAPSRFKVVQVAEPPQIQVQPASQPRRNTSRFSVTRNYDSVYNPTVPAVGKPDRPEAKPSPESLTKTASCPNVDIQSENLPTGGLNPALDKDEKSTPKADLVKTESCPVVGETHEKHETNLMKTESCPAMNESDRPEAKPSPEVLEKTLSCPAVVLNEPQIESTLTEPVKNQAVDEMKATDEPMEASTDDKNVTSDALDVKSNENPEIMPNCNISDNNDKSQCETSDNNYDQNVRDAKYDSTENSDIKSINSDSVVSIVDKVEEVTHNEEIDDDVRKTETKLVKNTLEVSETEKVDVSVAMTVTTESKGQPREVEHNTKKEQVAMKQIEAITEDLGNLIQEMKDFTTKTSKTDCTNTDLDVPAIRGNIVLKKNKSESSLDSPDLEVSRLMNKKLIESPFRDSSSSLEISGSSVESLNACENVQKPIIIHESVVSDTELDRRKPDHVTLSTESSIDSNTSEITPVNCGNFLNMSVSSNESVSPIIFGKSKKIHDSLSSLEASVSSLDSGRHDKIMINSADSGIEYSLQNPSENKDDNSSNEGTLTNNSSLKDSARSDIHDTLTSPKRASSLLDVPALRNKGLDRMKKMSWVAPSPSFHIPRPEPEKETKLPTNLEKLLSLFQHPSSLFSRSSDDEKKTTSNTPPRKDSSLTSAFWSWGSTIEKDDKEDRDSSSEATDSTLSERIQVSFVDESFSKKLDSKTPSTDTDTLSEFHLQNSEEERNYKVTHSTTDELVQKLVLSTDTGSNGNQTRASDIIDLRKPNDLNKNVVSTATSDGKVEEKDEIAQPRTFAAVLKSSGSENSLDKQNSPEGQPVDKLPSKVIRGIKENISPESTLTSSMSNTKALAIELSERQIKNQPIVNAVWEVTDKSDFKSDDVKCQSDLAPIATIEETCEENLVVDFIDDAKFDDKNTSGDSGVTSLEGAADDRKYNKIIDMTSELDNVDLGKDALAYLIYENQEFDDNNQSLAQELKDAEIKELLDTSPELVVDEAIEIPEIFTTRDLKIKSPVIPERAKLKKSNSLEELSVQDEKDGPKTKTIAFKMPEVTTTPRDIPRNRLRTRSGSSPKSLPESLNKPCPLTKMDSILGKKKKKVSSLGKMARDSLLALNMTEEEIAEFRKSYKLTSVESLKSLESVSEDANSQSGNSVDSRCRSCLRMSQESLMSLDSISEDCRCTDEAKPGHSNR
ncbi:uncharacterized protein LOC128682008 [Plodia interpunctella]|uniref:uncharacterized protein LOC128682008 n=1 Tax=Plodia interpunctella TaxID=58824 RepID=UPI002367E60C|nr:uncharacterized protein LOC128682008 [Plodia interpunctella]